jgi:hypothetical protein
LGAYCLFGDGLGIELISLIQRSFFVCRTGDLKRFKRQLKLLDLSLDFL